MNIKEIRRIYEHKMSKPSAEQVAYANMLSKGMAAGLLTLIVTFILYISGFLTPHIPKENLPELWHLPVADYLAAASIEPGWNWVSLIQKGDFINFIGIAFLAGVTILCFIRIIPIYLKRKDRIFALIAIIEVAVLVFAASGILKTGGH